MHGDRFVVPRKPQSLMEELRHWDAPVGRSLGAIWAPGKHKMPGFPLHIGQSPALRWLGLTLGFVWVAQARTQPCPPVRSAAHTCPVSTRQGCSGMSMGMATEGDDSPLIL